MRNGWQKLPKNVKVTLLPNSAEKVLEEWDNGFEKQNSIYVKALMERVRKQLICPFSK